MAVTPPCKEGSLRSYFRQHGRNVNCVDKDCYIFRFFKQRIGKRLFCGKYRKFVFLFGPFFANACFDRDFSPIVSMNRQFMFSRIRLGSSGRQTRSQITRGTTQTSSRRLIEYRLRNNFDPVITNKHNENGKRKMDNIAAIFSCPFSVTRYFFASDFGAGGGGGGTSPSGDI